MVSQKISKEVFLQVIEHLHQQYLQDKEYVDILDNLDDFIEIWLKQSRKQLDKKTKPNTKRVNSGFKRKI